MLVSYRIRKHSFSPGCIARGLNSRVLAIYSSQLEVSSVYEGAFSSVHFIKPNTNFALNFFSSRSGFWGWLSTFFIGCEQCDYTDSMLKLMLSCCFFFFLRFLIMSRRSSTFLLCTKSHNYVASPDLYLCLAGQPTVWHLGRYWVRNNQAGNPPV